MQTQAIAKAKHGKSAAKPGVKPAAKTQIAFLFDEGGPTEKEVLGGKGAGLVELVQMDVPVPAGFTLTTAVARAYAQHGVVPKRLDFHLRTKLNQLERKTGKRFGDSQRPLLVSVRSGAAVSMPGMMDTVLNLGMTPQVAEALAAGDARFAWDSYQRFLSMFGEVVLGIDREEFEDFREVEAQRLGVKAEDLPAESLEKLAGIYRQFIAQRTGKPMADDVWEQLNMAVEAVLRSWNSERAVEFRRIHRIDNGLGTAVNVQAMAFGNRDEQSCSGVVFSCDVTTGDAGMWGEFLVQSQGEDVVAGIRTPSPISEMKAWNENLFHQLVDLLQRLEQKRGVPVEVEFTVESGKLYALQVRNAKLTAAAAATIAVRAVWSKRSNKSEALGLVTGEQVDALRLEGFEEQALAEAVQSRLLARGLAASHGAAVGKVVLSSAEAVQAAAAGEKVVLLSADTTPNDLPGMQAAVAIVTGTGGATCHAAVVARGLGKPAVVGCGMSDEQRRALAGRIVAVDGAGGVMVEGSVPLAAGNNTKEVNIFLKWVAEEEAKRWPAPRLQFDYFEQSERVERLIADFYISDAMATAARGTPLEDEALALRTQVHIAVAERLAVYLIVAIGGEMRHIGAWNPHCETEVNELFSKFKVERTGSAEHRSLAQQRTIAYLRTVSLAEQARFAELCDKAFRFGNWSGSVGGVPWANIARAAHGFLTGRLSHSLFADHTFDLQHNNGTVFGKHAMINTDWRHGVLRLLEQKKHAENLPDLYKRISDLIAGRYSEELLSPRVAKLYKRLAPQVLVDRKTATSAAKEQLNTDKYKFLMPGNEEVSLSKYNAKAAAELKKKLEALKVPKVPGKSASVKVSIDGPAQLGKSQFSKPEINKWHKDPGQSQVGHIWPHLYVGHPKTEFVVLDQSGSMGSPGPELVADLHGFNSSHLDKMMSMPQVPNKLEPSSSEPFFKSESPLEKQFNAYFDGQHLVYGDHQGEHHGK
jgi:phosphohistidine swiveling domain-containing protein